MIDLSMTLDRMKEEVGFIEYLVDESISPKKNPEKFVGFDGGNYLKAHNLSLEDARVISSKYLEKILSSFGIGNRISSDLREIFYNSSMHGNCWDKKKKIYFQMGYGNKGFIAQIVDSGKGFDYSKYLSNLDRGIKEKKNRGAGFNNFRSPNNVVSFEGKGNIVNYMCLVNQKDLIHWQNRILSYNLRKERRFDL